MAKSKKEESFAKLIADEIKYNAVGMAKVGKLFAEHPKVFLGAGYAAFMREAERKR